MVALSAAHGFAQVSGIAQAVVVHVECGTQSLGGAVHNAAKGRIPVLIFAGTSPYSQNGEAKGGRNEFIQWIQDVFDQRGLVRGYVKYDNEFRSAETVREITHRALRFAYSDPKGPVYVVGSREVLEAPAGHSGIATTWQGIRSSGLADEAITAIAGDLVRARRPLVVTSYLGRKRQAVEELKLLCERLGIGVLESVPNYTNFPHDHCLYLGNQWNTAERNPLLAEADVILVIDSDVPWIPVSNRPNDEATIHHIDVDPLKCQMPLAALSSKFAYQADACTALRQVNAYLGELALSPAVLQERKTHYANWHRRRRATLEERERPHEGIITPEYLTSRIRRVLDSDTLVMNEGISNYQVIADHLSMNEPGRLYSSGGGSLGWSGGAAIGAKLAFPGKTVVALSGDGSYMLSIPSTVYWMARRYRTPFLQVIYNNGGWKSPKLSALSIHPQGYVSRSQELGVRFDNPPDYAGIAAAAGGAFGRAVKDPQEIDQALEEAMHAVRVQGIPAILDVRLPQL
jgi:acetolactate synthase-1/2/3 large subunit